MKNDEMIKRKIEELAPILASANYLINDKINLLSEAILQFPYSAELLNMRGFYYREINHLELAVKDFINAKQIDKYYPASYDNLALYYQAQHDKISAIKEYQEAIDLGIKSASIYNNAGILYNEIGDFNKAIVSFKEAIKLDDSAEKKINLVVTYLNIHDYHNAYIVLKEAERVAKNDPLMFLNIGNIFLALNKTDDAINCFTSALRLDTNICYIFYSLGAAYNIKIKNYLENGDISNAEKLYDCTFNCLSRAVELKPNFTEAYLNLGTLFELKATLNPQLSLQDKLHALNSSLGYYQQVIRLNPQSQEIRVAFNRVNNIVYALNENNNLLSRIEDAPSGLYTEKIINSQKEKGKKTNQR